MHPVLLLSAHETRFKNQNQWGISKQKSIMFSLTSMLVKTCFERASSFKWSSVYFDVPRPSLSQGNYHYACKGNSRMNKLWNCLNQKPSKT